jgi:hypothetical protein
MLYCFQMNVMFQNNRGLRDLAKHLHIAECIREHCLDFVAVSQTDKRNYSTNFLNRLSGGEEFWRPSIPLHVVVRKSLT